MLGAADTDGVAGGLMPPRGVSEFITGAAVGLRATDGGLRPPPPISVEPSGIPTRPTVEAGPIVEAIGGDAVADTAQAPGALAAIPPPSKSGAPDIPELAMAADAPVVGLPKAAEAGVGEAPAHVAPIMGATPDVVGVTPGVARLGCTEGNPSLPDLRIGNAKRRRHAKRRQRGAVHGGLCMRSAAAQERCHGTGNQGGRKRMSVYHDVMLSRRRVGTLFRMARARLNGVRRRGGILRNIGHTPLDETASIR